MASERNRSSLTGPAALLALLAALGIGTSQFRSQSSTPPAPLPKRTVRAPKTTEQEFYEHSAAQLLDEFLGTSLPPVRSDKPWSKPDQPPAMTDGESNPRIPRENYHVDFLIAMLPEPASPPLRYQFDSQLRAVQMAMGQAGYTLASFDLPWVDEAKDDSRDFRFDEEVEGRPRLGEPSHPLYRIKPNTEDENRSEQDPGVMLFVQDTNLLVMLIVGDTPTHGVNKKALRDALDQIAWLRGLKSGTPTRYLSLTSRYSKTSGTPEFKIIGPAFSGSVESLRNTLQEWMSSLRDTVSVHVVSGAATAISDELDGVAVYESVRLPDAQVEAQILDDLMRGSPEPIQRQARPPDSSAQLPQLIAILSDNTSYGAEKGERKDVVRMSFPLHISDLRNAFGVVPRQAGGSSALGHSNLPFPNESDRGRARCRSILFRSGRSL